MRLPWISRHAADEVSKAVALKLMRRHTEEIERERAAAGARVLAVSQERDWLRARNEQLTDVIIGFKKDGYGTPTKGSVRQAPDVEGIALERAEGQLTKQFLANAEADIAAKTGITGAAAKAEARRLREEAVSQQPAG